MVAALHGPPARTGSRLLGVLAVLWTGVAAGSLLLPDPLADAFFAGWVLVSVGIAFAGALAAWTNRTPLAWVAALLLVGLSIAGMWSIGRFIAPAAVALLGAALCSQLAGPRTDAREAIVTDLPSRRKLLRGTSVSAIAVIVGGGLVYGGAVRRELFGACARETVACAIANTHWDAVGITALGLLTVGIGGWVLWTKLSVARVLASGTDRE